MGGTHNSVHSDAIWRQTIRYELNTANNWEKNWGFIRQAMIENKLISKKGLKKPSTPTNLLPPIPHSSQRTGLPSKYPPGLKDENNPIIEDWLFTPNVPSIIKYKLPSEKYYLPTTTTHDIGWPWGLKEEPQKVTPVADRYVTSYKRDRFPTAPTLEIFGKQARGQGDVLKWFGAPEALP